MKKSVKIQPVLPLSQAIHENFCGQKGYDPFTNLKSHEGSAMYDSYLHQQKNIASCLTSQGFQISFINKFYKDE